ncbi:MAG: hypothetical protein ACXAEF_06655 [Candidatus Thorarchaeota archaeon]|jgi:hypothetical protein
MIDNDNLIDTFEVKKGTDPLDDGSDADTYLDGFEVIAGTNPLDPLSYPGTPTGIDPMLIVIAVCGIGGVIVVIVIVSYIKKKKG